MKKTITILLLLLVGLNTFGLYPIYKLLLAHAKELAENTLKHPPTADLIVFTDLHNNKDIIWEEENKEFSYKGKMYDIVKEEEEEGNLLYYCYNDKKEAAITNRIDVFVNKQLCNDKDPYGNAALHLIIMLAQAFIPAEPYSFTAGIINDNNKTETNFHCTGYPDCILEILLPPPWHNQLS